MRTPRASHRYWARAPRGTAFWLVLAMGVFAFSFVLPQSASAQGVSGAEGTTTGLGLSSPDTAPGVGGHTVGRSANQAGRSRYHYSWRGRPVYGDGPLYRYRGPHYNVGSAYGFAVPQYTGGYYGTPWHIGQSWKRNIHPLAEQGSLQLGLDTYEVYAYGGVTGLELPVDSDPFVDTRLPPFEGVVAASLRAKRERQLLHIGGDGALELMQAGKFREAGQRLAKQFKQSRSPRYPLLLAEVFFALGKFDHAELLLHEALSAGDVTDYLPRDVRSHFPSADVYQKRLDELLKGDRNLLTRAYFLVHSAKPERGIDLLHTMVINDPEDDAASILYRYYLGEAFREETE